MKNNMIILVLVLSLLIITPNTTDCGTRNCSNVLIINNYEFRIRVRNFITNVSKNEAGTETYIYLKPGSYVSKAEKKLLRNLFQNESFYFMIINKHSDSFYKFNTHGSYNDNLTTTEIKALMSFRDETFSLYNYSFILKTMSYREYLSYNLSIQLALNELNVSRPSLETKGSMNEWFINLNVNHLTISIEEIIKDELNVLLPFKPLIIDPLWREMLINMLIENLTYRYKELGGYRYIFTEVYSPFVDVVTCDKNYVLNITSKTMIRLSNIEYVKLYVINASAKSLENNSIMVEFEIHGRGIGDSRERAIKNTLLNTIEISKTYGCFKLETIGVKIMINDSILSYVDENLVLNNFVIEEIKYSWIGDFAKLMLIIFITVTALAVSIIALLIKTRRLGFQAKPLERT